MAFPPHNNFALSTVAVVPIPASSGTTLTVASGDGAKFHATLPNRVVVCPSGSLPTTANAEIMDMTLVTGDAFIIVRTRESSSARTITAGDSIFQAEATAGYLNDLEALITTSNIVTATPSDPSATDKMQGLAIAFTPSITGKIRAYLACTLNPGAASTQASAQIHYGTGTAPVNGAASAGTAVGSMVFYDTSGIGSSFFGPANCFALITGATIGVALWFDFYIGSDGGDTPAITNVYVALEEVK